MATLSYPFSLMMRFLLCSSLLFILISCFLKRSNALEGRRDISIGSHYHTVKISSLLPASICSPSTIKGSNKMQPTLQVFHRHGPCSHQGKDKFTTGPSLSQVLFHDQTRVESIQARINPNKLKNTNSNSNRLNDKKTNLPLHEAGQSLDSGNYIVLVGLGTPTQTLALIFDTGTDLTWTQCKPCMQPCNQQRESPFFRPSDSSSYSNVSCASDECSALYIGSGDSPLCVDDTCLCDVDYAGQFYAVGFLGRDNLTLTETDAFPDFLFGCGLINQGLSGPTAGSIGLGKNAVSIVSQTAEKYGRYFSYCFPSVSRATGHLILGRSEVPSNMKFTAFARSQGDTSFYYIDIVSISVGGSQLPINQSVFETAGSIIDSGTVITRLPSPAYTTLSDAFRREMARYPSAPAYSILGTCYDLSGYTNVTVPTISFTFGGDVKIDLHPSGTLIVVSESRSCLAFAANSDESDVAIFGNTQQKTFEVGYDVAAGNLGFAPGGC